jgi:hypothetical protein
MMAGTSPAVTTVGGHHQAAVQANTGKLYLYGVTTSGTTQYGMAAGTSPAIQDVTGGWQALINAGDLWLVGVTTSNTNYGMASGTSTAVTKQ